MGRRGAGGREILLVDHEDSFTWNLAHALRELGARVVVEDHRAVTPARLRGLGALVLGPGPHGPSDVPGSLALARAAAARGLPTLGVCLGLQILGVSLGGRVRRATRVAHGVVSEIAHGGAGLFAGLPRPARFVRYHSLVLQEPLPPALEVTARDEAGDVAAAAHRARPQWGVQFHPESLLSESGDRLLDNFLRRAAGGGA